MTRSMKLGLLSLIAAAATIWLLPAASLGGEADLKRVENDLRGATQGVGSAVDQAAAPVSGALRSTKKKTSRAVGATTRKSATTRQTTDDPARNPPLHGTNPHGQGSVAVADLDPSRERPLSGDTDGSESGEEVVVGRARGEQTDGGGLRGRITILALFGNELAGVETTEGQRENGPLQPIQEGVLDPLCVSSNNQICLSLLTADSETTGNRSTNDFAVARARVGELRVGAAESAGAIENEQECQNAAGAASAANVTTSGEVVAAVASSRAASRSCRDQPAQVDRESRVIQLGREGVGVPLPAAGCGDGTPDTVVEIPLVVTIVCNADDVAGAAVVRDALDVFVLNTGENSLLRESTASSEALTVAPAGAETGGGPQCSDGVDNDGDGVIDAADPGCHTDGNPNNPASFDPNDNSEADGGGPTRGAGDENGGTPECSDNRDNDGDGRIDEDDPGCHSDGDPNNPASFNPDDDDESDSGGGGGGGGGDARTVDAGALPFTGTNIVGLLLAGLLMLAGGLVLRRREDAHAGS